MGNVSGVTKANICFDCENACGGCSWSQTLEKPPNGATYTPVYKKRKNKPDLFITYSITACPLFKQTPNRRSVGMISEEENAQYETPHKTTKRRYTRRQAV